MSWKGIERMRKKFLGSSYNEIQRIIFKIFFFTFSIFLLLHSFERIKSADIWWHLKTGEEIVKNLRVPDTDPFSYTFGFKEWIDPEWFFQVFIYILHSFSGFYGLYIFRIIIVGFAFFSLYRNLSLLTRGRKGICILLLFFVLMVSQSRFHIRPHLFSLLFLSFYFYLLNLYETESIKRGYIFLLIPLHLLWANIHGSFMIGIFLVGVYLFDTSVYNFRNLGIRSLFLDKNRNLAILLLSLVAVSFVNPYSYKTVFYPFFLFDRESTSVLRYIKEWQGVTLKELFGIPTFYRMIFISFRLLLFGTLLSIILNCKRIKLRDVLIFVVFTYLAVKHRRWIGITSFMLAPLLASNLSGYLDSRRDSIPGLKEKGQDKWEICSQILCIVVIVLDILHFKVVGMKNFGLGVTKNLFPETPLRFIKENKIRGRIFNDYDFGGYLIYHLYPTMKVFIDGRTPTLFPPAFYVDFIDAYSQEDVWRRLERDYGISVALIKPKKGKLCSLLMDGEDWGLVAFDSVSALFLKDVPEMRKLTLEKGYRYLNPCDEKYIQKAESDKKALENIRLELKRAIEFSPEAAFLHFQLALTDTKLGGKMLLSEAVEEYLEVMRLQPDYSGVHNNLGLVYASLGRFDDAVREYLRELELNPEYGEAYYNMGIAYYQKGVWDLAVSSYKEALKYSPDDIDILNNLANTYTRIGLLDNAISTYKEALRVNPDAVITHYNLSVAYRKKGLLKQAIFELQEALRIDPDFEGAKRRLREIMNGEQ